jgi:ParB-like chromosome segregation protein Spo0J
MLTTTTHKVTSVPLDLLAIAPANVRRSATDVDDLVASIKAHGLINPLAAVSAWVPEWLRFTDEQPAPE